MSFVISIVSCLLVIFLAAWYRRRHHRRRQSAPSSDWRSQIVSDVQYPAISEKQVQECQDGPWVIRDLETRKVVARCHSHGEAQTITLSETFRTGRPLVASYEEE